MEMITVDIPTGLWMQYIGKACDLQSSTQCSIRTLPVSIRAIGTETIIKDTPNINDQKAKERLRVP
jgi:hypothetical protein